MRILDAVTAPVFITVGIVAGIVLGPFALAYLVVRMPGRGPALSGVLDGMPLGFGN